MWWYRALHSELLGALEDHTMPAARPVLDAGCGTGGFLCRLAATAPSRARFGIEVMEAAARMAGTRSRSPICVGTVNQLPLADCVAGAVVSADVLCHAQVDQAQALAEFRRVLAPGGMLVLNLPAFQWLLSAHDRAVHNIRRYTRAGTASMLESAGFRVLGIRYWNSLLFPLMVIQRKVLARDAAASDVQLHPAPVEALFRGVTALERTLVRLGLRFPFGGSVLAVAQKP